MIDTEPRLHEVTQWTCKALTRQCLLELDKSYDLVYVEYDDKFTPEQVAMIVRGDYEALWDTTSEWESDARQLSSLEYARDLAKTIAERWERSFDVDAEDLLVAWDGLDAVQEAICDRDSGSWFKDLARNTPRVLMRHVLRGEDNAINCRAWPNLTVTDTLKWLREGAEDGTVLKRNKQNMGVVRAVLNEAFHTEAYLMGMIVYAIEIKDLIDLPEYTEHVDIVNPHLYLGNYYNGDGWCDGPLDATIRVKREDMRTDRDAAGYGWDEVAGVITSYYETDIIAVTPNPKFGAIEGAKFYGGFEHHSVSREGIKDLGTYELWARGSRFIIRSSTGETEEHSKHDVTQGLSSPAPWPLPWRVLLDRYNRYTD